MNVRNGADAHGVRAHLLVYAGGHPVPPEPISCYKPDSCQAHHRSFPPRISWGIGILVSFLFPDGSRVDDLYLSCVYNLLFNSHDLSRICFGMEPVNFCHLSMLHSHHGRFHIIFIFFNKLYLFFSRYFTYYFSCYKVRKPDRAMLIKF